jgi:hypothetical protein
MTYTALAVVFLLVSVGLGARGVADRRGVALCLAMAMIAAQFALLMSS